MNGCDILINGYVILDSIESLLCCFVTLPSVCQYFYIARRAPISIVLSKALYNSVVLIMDKLTRQQQQLIKIYSSR